MGGMRVVTAIVAIPLVYLLVKYLNPFYFLFIVAIVVLMGQYEFYRFFYKKFNSFTLLGLSLGFLLLLAFYREDGTSAVKEAALSMVIVIALSGFLFFKKDLQDALTGVSVLVFGVLYVAWTLGHLISLRHFLNGRNLIFFILIVTWGVDTGAYYVGRLVGKHKLAPQVSPGKTIEGAIGGLITALGAAFLARWWFLPELATRNVVMIGLLLGVISQLGDLSESLLKRSAGVKDSGGLFPAHGGMLDRVDSLIFNIPAFYYYLLYIAPEMTRGSSIFIW